MSLRIILKIWTALRTAKIPTFIPTPLYFFLSLICLSSCGYHWSPDLGQTVRPTISVPFVEGDGDGSLTQAIVYALSSSGMADVRQAGARYRLCVSIVHSGSQTIGYRRDRQKISGEIKKNLVSAEGRKTVSIEATVYEKDKIVCGPIRLNADSDYDYLDGDSMQDLAFINPFGVQQTVLPFSLGQLEPKEAAEEATTKPLNGKIAGILVDAIFNVWYTKNL